MVEEVVVLIVGAGPAGLAASACLNRHSIPNCVIERDDCCASLWKNRAYDRLKLHLAKHFCELPYKSFSPDTPKYVPREQFISYLDDYVSHFEINPQFNHTVESAFYDKMLMKWSVNVRDTKSNVEKLYVSKFLVVASGENSEGLIPFVHGLDSFKGKCLHSSKYTNGKIFEGENVLVVGCGNSGMEIAYDLYKCGANTSIVARSPVHIVTKEIVFIGMSLLKYLPLSLVDWLTTLLSQMKFGDISKHGFQRPKEGPFYSKVITGRSPTIDVGAMNMVKTGEIKVFPSVTSVKGDTVTFKDGKIGRYDTIIFATGYKSTVQKWLKESDQDNIFNENGMPKKNYLSNWKGQNGLYAVGFGQKGLSGIAQDAKNVANDIAELMGEIVI